MACRESLAVEAGDGLLGAAHEPRVGRIIGVDDAREEPVHAAPGVGHRLLEVVEALLTQALHLALREARLQRHLGQQLHGRAEPRARHLHLDAEAVPAGAGAEAGAQPLGGFHEGHRVAPGRALRHRPGGQHGHPRLVGRLRGGPSARVTPHEELGLQQGSSRHVGADEREPARQLRALEVGEVVVARSAGAGTPVEDARSLMPRPPPPSAGTYVSTARPSPPKTSAQTSRTASASTAW